MATSKSKWQVNHYGNHFSVERDGGRDRYEWLGGWNAAANRPNRLFGTLADATAACEAANKKSR